MAGPSIINVFGGSKNATLYFDIKVINITSGTIHFVPDPGISSISVAADGKSVLVDFSGTAVPGNTYTVTIDSPPVTDSVGNNMVNNTLTFPMVYGSYNANINNITSGTPDIQANVFKGSTIDIDVKNNTRIGPAGIGKITYVMRAYNTSTSSYVRWTVGNSPDFSGLRSPYSIAVLSDIVLEKMIYL